MVGRAWHEEECVSRWVAARYFEEGSVKVRGDLTNLALFALQDLQKLLKVEVQRQSGPSVRGRYRVVRHHREHPRLDGLNPLRADLLACSDLLARDGVPRFKERHRRRLEHSEWISLTMVSEPQVARDGGLKRALRLRNIGAERGDVVLKGLRVPNIRIAGILKEEHTQDDLLWDCQTVTVYAEDDAAWSSRGWFEPAVLCLAVSYAKNPQRR